MTEATPLDIAHAAMMADESDDAARLRFYERMADVELFLLLEDEPDADQVSPVLLEELHEQLSVVLDGAQLLAVK